MNSLFSRNLINLAAAALLVSACDMDSGKIDLSDNKARALAAPVRQAPCLDNNPQRTAYFGDFHVHTGYSSDGWLFKVRATPQDAYRYAFGGEVLLAPNNASDTRGTRPVRIDRPLDFMAVTDHAEYFAEGRFCADERLPEYQSEYCQEYREGYGRDMKQLVRILSPMPWRDADLCGESGERCKEVAHSVWQDTVQAAEDWNDTSENCERTTFIGYEYSSVRLGSNLHRNVIFRNSIVPPNPVSYIEATRVTELWQHLDQDCLSSGTGCDVFAIPHNSNISNGRMFAVDYPGAGSAEEQRAQAALRMKIEPLVEIMQHKGDSECRNGLSNVIGAVDELCEFEKFESFAFKTTVKFGEVGDCYEGPFADSIPHLGPNCLSKSSYIRTALVEGLKEEARLGINPFKFGLSASTDTHNGLGGGVNEKTFPGHLGTADDTVEKRTAWSSEVIGNASNNPGGLIGVWAEENSRAAIFKASKRKEVFGTSGPRIQPRLFAGWDYPASLCDDPRMLEKAYEKGVPMGADLPDRGTADAPVFIASALADPGTVELPGTPLQRLQVVKGWVDDNGVSNEKVFDIAGDAGNSASVNLDNCEQSGPGFTQLCTVWQDPEFDASRRAVYYLRAVENPSCRYTAWQCAGLPPEQRPADCSRPEVRKAIQERAWSSPIWYTPAQSDVR